MGTTKGENFASLDSLFCEWKSQKKLTFFLIKRKICNSNFWEFPTPENKIVFVGTPVCNLSTLMLQCTSPNLEPRSILITWRWAALSPCKASRLKWFSRICNRARYLGFPPLWQIPTLINMRAPQLATVITSSPIDKLQNV